MKSILLTALLAASHPAAVFANQSEKSDQTGKAEKTEKADAGADAAWARVEKLLEGPTEDPESPAEAKKVFADFTKQFDAEAEAFSKAFPNDARRWQLPVVQCQWALVQAQLLGVPLDKKRNEERLATVAAAAEAAPDVKATASLMDAMINREDIAAFKAKAEAHFKKYPDFQGNQELKMELKKQEAMATLKEKPLDLKFKAADGSDVDIAKLKGKVVLIDFWATWCGPCVREIPNVKKTYDALHGKGFEIIGISLDREKAPLEKMVKEKAMPWPQCFDQDNGENSLAERFGIATIPTMWLVDKKGMVADTDAREDLQAKVEKLLAAE